MFNGITVFFEETLEFTNPMLCYPMFNGITAAAPRQPARSAIAVWA